ncbi:MAG: hypothetical protein FWD68_09390 [Alphaproteobacteria bacterium]|nr:hypothetical protein [Alphaproteobacteria bacterium]
MNQAPLVPAPAAAAADTSRSFRTGLVLRQSVRILQARIGTWLLIGLADTTLAVAAALLPNGTLASWLVQILIGALIQAMITYAAFELWCGQDFRLGDTLKQGAGRFLPVLSILLLFLLAIILTFLGALVLGPHFRPLVAASGIPDLFGAPSLETTLASILASGSCLALFVFLAIRFSVVVPACVIEGADALTGIKRSFRLTSGHFWNILAAFVVLLAVILGFAAVVIGLFYLATLLTDPSLSITSLLHPSRLTTEPELATTVILLLFFLIYMPAQWLFSAFAIILITAIYANLRIDSEGFTTDRAADVLP